MLNNTTATLISLLPTGFVTFISRKVVEGYLKKYATISINGKEKLDKIKKPTIFICNHLSNSDGLVLDKVLKSVDPTFVAGVKLSDNKVTNIGVNVIKTTNIIPNTSDREGLKRVIKLVKSGESLLIFPEGTRSRVGSLIQARRGILLIARMTGAPIVPLALHGTEKLLPINKEGNMSAETFHHAKVEVTIGDQYDLPKKQEGQDKKVYEEELLNHMMKSIATLLPEDYRGVYK